MTLGSVSGRTRASYTAVVHLAVYGLAVALPLIAAMLILFLYSVTQQRAQLESRVIQVLNNLIDSVDRDFQRHVVILETLASSPFVQQRDWRSFYDQAKAALQGTTYLILVDPTGHQVVNTYVPYGTEPETTGDMDSVGRVLATKRPVFSKLFVSKVSRQPVLNASIPILVDGSVAYVMSLAIWPRDVVRMLDGLSLGPEWGTTIWDDSGAVVARSREFDRYLGTQLPERLRARGQDQQVYRTRDFDDVGVWRAVSISKVSGLHVGANVAAAFAERETRPGVWFLAGTATAGLLLAVGLALVFARTISMPLSHASAAAAALGRNEAPVLVHSRLTEANAVSHTLGQAFDEIKERTASLAENRRQLAAVLEILPLGIALVDTSGRTVLSNSTYDRFVPGKISSAGGDGWALWEAYEGDGTRMDRKSYPASRARVGRVYGPGSNSFTAETGNEVPTGPTSPLCHSGIRRGSSWARRSLSKTSTTSIGQPKNEPATRSTGPC
jgi:PAS domain-containing protein